MKNIIYRNHALTTFEAAFMSEAMSYSTTLTFTTREEYLAWVKQWKEDYKIVEHKRKIEVLTYRRDACTLQENKDYYQTRIDKIPTLTSEQETLYKLVVDKVQQEMGLTKWEVFNTYWVIISLLIIRKAGKVRANAQRNARLLEQKQTV